jgi:hypothetical protein
MQMEMFAIVDAATESGGKLNVLGAFDTLYAPKVPSVHPQCAVVARIRFTQPEKGKHAIAVRIEDEAGKALLPPLRGELTIAVGGTQPSGAVNLIMNIQGLKVEHYGQHMIRLEVDGNVCASIPLFVNEPPSSAKPN